MANYSSRDFNNSAIIPYPLAFLTDKALHALPYPEKEMYAYLKRRMNLSMQNRKYYEDQNGLFIYYKQAEIAKELHVSERHVRNTFHGMVEHGLIETVKQGFGLPQKIYLKNVSDVMENTSGTTNTAGSGTTNTAGSGTTNTGPLNIEIRDIEKRDIDKKRYREETLLFLEFAGANQTLLEALLAWKDMRSKIKAPLTEYAIKLALKKLQTLSGSDERVMVEIINQSVENCYKGFFPLKGSGHMAPKKSKSQSVYERLEALDEGRTEKGIGNFG